MAIIYDNKKISLTDNSAKSFTKKLKSKNLDASKKRDAFIKESKQSLKITTSNNITTIRIKNM
ncbi:hypothetical protein [Terrisporobacter sp.]|uniref:hypothetical protein n=1 Tax=Terrisporobacter sp. TaxID=1965305 RepID=UPI00263404E3|nr:hypothetical protein [Terrisporobacter sp.]